jgi:hypothetical protein
LAFQNIQHPIHAAPLLVLPGWFIERRRKLPVVILSGREVTAHVPKLNGTSLTPDEVCRIAALIGSKSLQARFLQSKLLTSQMEDSILFFPYAD